MTDRSIGALLGLAVGDALGTTLEFERPGSFKPLTDMVGGGPFGLAAGQWTDDTSMALCLGESLLKKGFSPGDQLQRYLRWYRDGHFSSTGTCFDIGNTVRSALHEYEANGDPDRSGVSHSNSAGNGSIMRLAPIPIRYQADPAAAIEKAAASSRTTHAHPEAVDGCRYLAAVIVGALQGRPKEEILSARFAPVPGVWDQRPLAQPTDAVAAGSFKDRQPPEIRGTGYVTASLEAALWAFASSETFEAGALRAVNLGDDADTTGAVYGQIAGAFYGAESIPIRWRRRVALRRQIEAMAERLDHAGRSR